MSCPRCRELVDDHARLLAGGSFSAIVFILLLVGQALLEPLAHALHAGSLRVLLGLVGALEHGAVRVGRQKGADGRHQTCENVNEVTYEVSIECGNRVGYSLRPWCLQGCYRYL